MMSIRRGMRMVSASGAVALGCGALLALVAARLYEREAILG